MTTTFPATGKVRLKTNLADYPVVRALKAGEVKSELVEFDFCGPRIANQGFKPMIREGAYDAGELAIGSFLQAKVYGKPLVLLPAVVMARFQHHTILYNAAKGELSRRTWKAGVLRYAPMRRPPASGCAASSSTSTASI